MVSVPAAFSALATVVTLAFTLALADRCAQRKRPHEICWLVAFVAFGLGSASVLWGVSAGWNPSSYRVFYLTGGVITVPVLALGTIYLLVGEHTAHTSLRGVVIWCAFGTGVVVSAGFVTELPAIGLPLGSEVFGFWPRFVAAFGSAVGSVVVIGGAIYSAIRVRRVRFVISNSLIAIGTIIVAAKGILPAGWDEATKFSISLAIGISVMFIGFLTATASGSTRASARPAIEDEPGRKDEIDLTEGLADASVSVVTSQNISA